MIINRVFMSEFGLSRFILLTRRSIDVRRNQLLEMSTVFEEKVKEGDSFVQEVCTLSLAQLRDIP